MLLWTHWCSFFLICPDQNMCLPSDGSYDAGLRAQVLWWTPVWSNAPTPQEHLSTADVPTRMAPPPVLTSVTADRGSTCCFATVASRWKCDLSVFICSDRTLSRENCGPLFSHWPSYRNLNFLERKQELYSWLDLEIFRTRCSVAKAKLTWTTDVSSVLLPCPNTHGGSVTRACMSEHSNQ